MSEGRPDLLTAPVGEAMRALAVPFGLGIVFIIALNLADTYFVSLLGTNELAVMSFTFPVVSLVMSVAMGLGVGTTSAVSRAIGRGDQQQVRSLTTHAIILATAVVMAVSAVGLATQDLVFTALGADEALLPMLDEYMTVWYFGAAFLVVPMVGTSAIRATGDAKTPMTIMMVAAVVNIVLDPVFIFGFAFVPAMGLKGAAIATVVARSATLVLALWILIRRERMIVLQWPVWSEVWRSWRAILSVGLPAVVTNMVVPLATGVMTLLVAQHGAAAVAAYGVASRVEGLLLIPPMALSGALSPFVGQNYGAHHTQRVARGIVVARNFVVAWGAGAWVLLALVGGFVGGVFTDDPEVLEAVRLYLWIVPISYGANGLVSVASASFNAVDKAVRSTVLAAVRSLVLAIPLAALGSAVAGLTGIFIGIAAATVVSAAVAFVWMRGLLIPATRRDAAHRWEAKVPELTHAIEAVIDALEDLEDLDVHPTRARALGLYVGGHELGHIHRGGQLDLAFSPEICGQLEREDKVEHHRIVPDSCWVTHRIATETDVEEAAWLLRLAYASRLLASHGRDQEGRAEAELSALALSKALASAVHASVARATKHRAVAAAS